MFLLFVVPWLLVLMTISVFRLLLHFFPFAL
jgi:hypothetical protein